MAFTKLLFTAIALGSAQLAKAVDLQPCGGAYYDRTQYACYDKFLCPKFNGEATQKCGASCFDTYMYTCNNGTLELLPRTSSGFTLTASNPYAAFNGKTIEASGRHFYIGQGPGTYCPAQVPASACPPGNQTILFGGSGMAVMVPGGQLYYVEPNGALGYTQAHSAGYPTGSTFGVAAYEHGGFIFSNGPQGWWACPVDGKANVWQVFAKLPNINFDAACVGFNAKVETVPQGTLGAWQYT